MIKLKDLIEGLASGYADRVQFKGLKKNSVVELHDGSIVKILERVVPRQPMFFAVVEKVGTKIKNTAGKKAKVGDTVKFAEAYVKRRIK